jgi:hypothetical protein
MILVNFIPIALIFSEKKKGVNFVPLFIHWMDGYSDGQMNEGPCRWWGRDGANSIS